MRAIVTGATGFIGSWLITELIQEKYEVVAIARDKTKLLPEILESFQCKIIEKKIEDLEYADFDTEKSYDIFFHLGWGGVSPEQKNDVDLQVKNILLSIKALEVCNQIGCKKFIAAGTVAEYAFGDGIIDVNAQQSPNDIYGAAKVATYYFLNVRARQLKKAFNWIIIPSTYGERRRDNNIITYTINSLLNGERPQYGDMKQMWDFLYVGEVVRAIRLIGEKGVNGKTYGIGSGDYRPLYDYITRIKDLINPNVEIGVGEIAQMSAQTTSSCVDIYDLKKDTGFTPMVSFDDGILKTINFYRKH